MQGKHSRRKLFLQGRCFCWGHLGKTKDKSFLSWKFTLGSCLLHEAKLQEQQAEKPIFLTKGVYLSVCLFNGHSFEGIKGFCNSRVEWGTSWNFSDTLPPSVRGSWRYSYANEPSASQVKSLEWEEGKHLFLLFWESYKGTAISFNRFALWILHL